MQTAETTPVTVFLDINFYALSIKFIFGALSHASLLQPHYHVHFQVNVTAPFLLPDPIIQPQMAGSFFSYQPNLVYGILEQEGGHGSVPKRGTIHPSNRLVVSAFPAMPPGIGRVGHDVIKRCCHITQQDDTLGSTTATWSDTQIVMIPVGTLNSGSLTDLGFMPSS